jgi:hypothetical protein
MKERDERVSVDPNSNKIFVPGSGNIPIVGLDPKKLDTAEKRNHRDMLALRRMLLSTWQCTACRQKFPGREVRAKKDGLSGVAFVCPECSGPIVIMEDALSLTVIPGGKS